MVKLTPIRRIQVTPKMRYAIALVRRAEQFAVESGRFFIFDAEMVRLGRMVFSQVRRQEARRRRRLAEIAKRPKNPAGVIEVTLRRKRRA